MVDRAPARYERAALRLRGRLVEEAGLSLEDAIAALALLAALSNKRAREWAHALADLVGADRKLLPVAEVLSRWGGPDLVAS